jgi:hypothetical protein
MTAASLKFRAATAALVAAAAFALAGCGGDGAGASNTAGATQTAPGGTSGGGSGSTTAAITVTVSSAVPTSGNGEVTGTAVLNQPLSGTTRSVIAEGVGPTGLVHRVVVDYDSVAGVVLAVTHSWGASAGVGDARTGCVRVVTPTIPTLCTGTTIDLSSGRVTFANTLLRGGGAFTSLLNGTITFPAP